MRSAGMAVALAAVVMAGCKPNLEGYVLCGNHYREGDQISETAKLTVRNTGTANVQGSMTASSGQPFYKVDLVLSTDRVAPVEFATVPDPYRFEEDMLLQGGRISTKTVLDGKSVEYSVDDPPELLGLIPPGMPALPTGRDTFYLIAVIDPGNEIAESDETDNLAVAPFQLTR